MSIMCLFCITGVLSSAFCMSLSEEEQTGEDNRYTVLLHILLQPSEYVSKCTCNGNIVSG